jgi:putative ABC transport system permease protein
MLLFTYLGRELRHRLRQTILVAFGLAIGIGLVLTVTATASGARAAQSKVLASLYGLGTDITVAKTPSASLSSSGGGGSGGGGLSISPGTTTQHIDQLSAPGDTFSPSVVGQVAHLPGVAAATGELALMDTKVTVPAGQPSQLPLPTTIAVDGVDPAHTTLGPLGQASVTSGRMLKAADANADVAVVDATYAKKNSLKVGSTVTLGKKPFKVVGIVQQGADSAEQVFVPLARAQATAGLTGKIGTVYVAAASSGQVDQVAKEITNALSWATVTTSSSLADQVTGSLADTARLADDLGRWVAFAALIAAFTLAVLLTLSSVARRVREFGTLKAVGWRTRRVVGQVVGESVAVGVVGGALGVGLGYAGTAVIAALAPSLNASVPAGPGNGPLAVSGGPASGGGAPTQQFAAPASHTIAVHLSMHVAQDVVLLALALGVAGGLLAGAFGGWRAGRLRPAAALGKIA